MEGIKHARYLLVLSWLWPLLLPSPLPVLPAPLSHVTVLPLSPFGSPLPAALHAVSRSSIHSPVSGPLHQTHVGVLSQSPALSTSPAQSSSPLPPTALQLSHCKGKARCEGIGAEEVKGWEQEVKGWEQRR